MKKDKLDDLLLNIKNIIHKNNLPEPKEIYDLLSLKIYPNIQSRENIKEISACIYGAKGYYILVVFGKVLMEDEDFQGMNALYVHQSRDINYLREILKHLLKGEKEISIRSD